jgi:hypothetical protein
MAPAQYGFEDVLGARLTVSAMSIFLASINFVDLPRQASAHRSQAVFRPRVSRRAGCVHVESQRLFVMENKS